MRRGEKTGLNGWFGYNCGAGLWSIYMSVFHSSSLTGGILEDRIRHRGLEASRGDLYLNILSICIMPSYFYPFFFIYRDKVTLTHTLCFILPLCAHEDSSDPPPRTFVLFLWHI